MRESVTSGDVSNRKNYIRSVMDKIEVDETRRRSKDPATRRCSHTFVEMARPERFELPTLGSEDRCSIQLSYGRGSDALLA